jgi:uncharacterized protein YdeI (YjbR/CyaY-like superfamily)
MAMLSKRRWPEETELLREILAEFPLTEEYKWAKPCYLLDGKNVALTQGFNEYIALMFFKGALMKDPRKLLRQPGENTQSARQLRFVDAKEIAAQRATIKAYVAEAIALEKTGAKVEMKKPAELVLPEELESAFKEMPRLKTAFGGLTPGRQRAYVLFINGAKKSATRATRVEKMAPRILDGLGIND